jgi:thiamine biosynthesis lipoprotein
MKLCRFVFLFICLVFIPLFSGCEPAKKDDSVRYSGLTMGTTWSVIFLLPTEATDAPALKQQLQQRLELINGLMSTYDPESELSQFNNQLSTDWYAISKETAEVVELSLEISRLTGGAFDVTVGPLVDLWGFGATPRGENIPTAEQIRQNLAQIGYTNLQFRRNPAAIKKRIPQLRVDLSAVAKGYAVDALAQILEQEGIVNYLVEIGGELRIAGHRSDGANWRIAIEQPLEDAREVATVFPLTDTALATSGNYRNFYLQNGQRYAHTIDPVTGQPIRHKLASATVLDQSCARADALTTALMVLGEKKGQEFCEKNDIAAYFLLHEKKSIGFYASPAFKKIVKEIEP